MNEIEKAYMNGVKRAYETLGINTAGKNTKQAGYWSEYASGLNPMNSVGTPLAALAALLTPTRSLEDQAEAEASEDFSTALANVLIPGLGPYKGFKRLGTSIRGRELKDMKKEIRHAVRMAKRKERAAAREDLNREVN